MDSQLEFDARPAGILRKLMGHWASLAPPPFNKLLHRLRGVRMKDPSTVFIGTLVSIDNKYPGLVSIGSHSTIAGGARLTAHFEPPAPIREKYIKEEAKPVQIGSNAFIGAGAIVLMGVKVGDWAVVGAGAVVTKDVPEFKIAAGNPARVIGDVREKKTSA